MKLTVRSHLDERRSINLDEKQFTLVYPFETVFNLKQRIAVVLGNVPPSQLFLATEIGSQHFRPLDFVWPFMDKDTEGLVNPQDKSVQEIPDARIYEDGAVKPVFPTILSGRTIEDALKGTAQIIHVWSLPSILTPNKPITEAIFEGFIKLYFPQLKSMPPGGTMSKDTLNILVQYREYVEKRLNKLDTLIRSPVVQTTEVPQMIKLYIFKTILKNTKAFTPGLLELRFYEMTPSSTKPFLRFFPAKDRIPSIVKVARNEDGKTLIFSEKLLDNLMADRPSTEMGAVILIKVPIIDPKAPLGTCWTLRIYEDGSAEMYIGAPRKGAPLPLSVITKANAMFYNILKDTPLEGAHSANLCELTAEYEINTTLDVRKPGKSELLARVDSFNPLFSIDPPLDGDTAALNLRYKGVSNYVSTSNPIMNYLTMLFLNHGTKTATDMPKGDYVRALVKEFGISPAEATAAETEWLQRHSEHVIQYKSEMGDDLRIKDVSIRDAKCSAFNKQHPADEDTTITAYNTGASVRIYNTHPSYRILITGCETIRDLNRMLTLMTLFVSQSASQLRVDTTEGEKEAVALVEPEETKAEAPEIPAEVESAFDEQLLQGMLNMGMSDEEETDEETDETVEKHAEAKPAEPILPSKPVTAPTSLAPNEKIQPIAKEWYLDNLKSRDRDLFQYSESGDARVKLYSRQCQLAQNRQPNVLSPEAYRRAKLLYEIPGTTDSKVIWREVPLDKESQEASEIASKTAGQRRGMPKADIAKLEIKALQRGFPLKENKSVTDNDDKLKEENKKIKELLVSQQEKPLWIVTKTGTSNRHINYYLCAEYWCVRDDLPIIEKEFKTTLGYDGKPKLANSCPFCRGTAIVNLSRPEIGETVLKRGEQADSGKVAKYSGFLKGLHPDKYPLPCCFTDAKKLAPPEGARILEDEEEKPEEIQDEEDKPDTVVAAVKDIANRDRPFSSYSKVERSGQTWYIPTQNILGRIKLDWFELDKGTVAVPPLSVNKFLGQNPEDFLTKNRGIEQQETNSHLLPYRENTTPAHAFIRYGIGHNVREPGKSILSLIGWAKYVTDEFISHNNTNQIPTEKDILDWFMDAENERRLARAFEQANYGSLIHEFATKKYDKDDEVTTGKLQEWCKFMGIHPSNTYSKHFYSAWHNFRAYVADVREPKDLRLWESLFTVPGLFTTTGCILVRIRIPKDRNEPPTLICPQFGISLHDTETPPPFLFLVQDAVTGNYDPLVFYDGKSEKDKKLYGVIQPESKTMATIPPPIAVALKTFIQDYVSVKNGCGRSVAPVHPWVPVQDMLLFPRLTELVALGEVDCSKPATRLLRDRSNRLVGVLSPTRAQSVVFIPCVDDGLILPSCPSTYGEDGLPNPPNDILQVLEKYMIPGRSTCTPADAVLPGLLPIRLRKRDKYIVAMDLRCGITIPIRPFKPKDITHPCYKDIIQNLRELKEGDEPWLADMTLLKPVKGESSLEVATKEEELEEAYQHLRITFSEFLATSEGEHIKKQIELLRLARRRLPLFELQKRLDLLLYPILRHWIKDENDRKPAKLSVLRRDCLQIKTKDKCVEGCTWTEGEEPLRGCLIHTTKTERYTDPVGLMVARLVDELLRTFGKAMELLTRNVPRLKPLMGNEIRYETGAMLFSAKGRGTEELYDILGYKERQPTRYTKGLTYPEEVGIDESSMALPSDWDSALYRDMGTSFISLDLSAFLNQIIRTLTNKDKFFYGSYDEWTALAKDLKATIILTHYDSMSHRIEPNDKIVGTTGPSPNYIVLDINGIPLRNKKNKKFILTEEELPASIRMWMS